MGMFAGDISGTTSAMKCFIEDWWGSEFQFFDDFYGNGRSYYAGKNAIPTDNATNKVAISANNAQTGFSKTTNIEYNLNTLINIASRHNVSGENP